MPTSGISNCEQKDLFSFCNHKFLQAKVNIEVYLHGLTLVSSNFAFFVYLIWLCHGFVKFIRLAGFDAFR